MILAAIDIGSNAIRLQISRVLTNDNNLPIFKKMESIRFPLRLGKDTFSSGEISFRSEAKFIDLMLSFRTLIDLYEADDAYACATSAFRYASNSDRILNRVYSKSGLHIDLISGEKEVEILSFAILKEIDDQAYMHIDVGGGSTEINMIENNQSYARNSFALGSVRNMKGRDNKKTWHELETWIKKHTQPNMKAIATGGNISALQKIAEVKNLTIDKLKTTNSYLNKYSTEEKIHKLGLREDRADVINYAANIYISAIESSGASEILVPEVGLKDGIIEMLYRRNI